jgi:phosphopantetheinyl transferase (holo-ACP synthase)
MNTKNLAINYFSKLLNCAIDDDTVITLRSGQSARAYAWLKANNFSFDEQQFRKSFSINQLLLIANNGLLGTRSVTSEKEGYPTALDKDIIAAPASIGVDIQSVTELFPEGLPSDPKRDPELLAIYTLKELSYAQSKPDPVQTLTGLFAAKEAVLKCSQKEINFTNIEILPDTAGKPITDGFLVSISHSLDNAVAIAMPTVCRKKLTAAPTEKYLPSSNDIGDEVDSNRYQNIFNFIIKLTVLIIAAIEIFRLFKYVSEV